MAVKFRILLLQARGQYQQIDEDRFNGNATFNKTFREDRPSLHSNAAELDNKKCSDESLITFDEKFCLLQ